MEDGAGFLLVAFLVNYETLGSFTPRIELALTNTIILGYRKSPVMILPRNL